MKTKNKCLFPVNSEKVLVFGSPREGAEKRETVSAVISRKDGRFLLVKWLKFGWVAPCVGGIDAGESPEAAMEREVLEETGYKVKAIRRLGAPIESHFFAENKNVWRHRIDQPILLTLLNESEAPSPVLDFEKNRQEPIWLTAKEALNKITHPDNVIGIRRFLGLADSLDELALRSLY